MLKVGDNLFHIKVANKVVEGFLIEVEEMFVEQVVFLDSENTDYVLKTKEGNKTISDTTLLNQPKNAPKIFFSSNFYAQSFSELETFLDDIRGGLLKNVESILSLFKEERSRLIGPIEEFRGPNPKTFVNGLQGIRDNYIPDDSEWTDNESYYQFSSKHMLRTGFTYDFRIARLHEGTEEDLIEHYRDVDPEEDLSNKKFYHVTYFDNPNLNVSVFGTLSLVSENGLLEKKHNFTTNPSIFNYKIYYPAVSSLEEFERIVEVFRSTVLEKVQSVITFYEKVFEILTSSSSIYSFVEQYYFV